jgi:hypothetical protein
VFAPVCFAAIGHTAELPSPTSEKTIHIQADTIQIEPESNQVTARGHVRLDVGELTIDASVLTLDLPQGIGELQAPFKVLYGEFTIVGQRLIFNKQTDTLKLLRPTIRLSNNHPTRISGKQGTCRAGTCTLTDMNGTACPHQPQGYRVRARKVTIHPSGDIDLYKPVVLVNRTPIAALPWIRLRPPDAAGFLFPRLGYDKNGGFVIGPAGYVPITRDVSAEGYIAVRTSEGFESRSKLTAPNLQVTLDHITYFPKTDAQLLIRGLAPLKETTAAMKLHLVTGLKIVDDMADDPLDRAITHTITHGLLSTPFAGMILETYTGFIQTFNGNGDATLDVLTPLASIALSLPSIPISRFFWPAFDLRLTRQGLPDQSPYLDSVFSPVAGHTRIELSPKISIPGRFGPLHTGVHIGTRHQVWLPDANSVSAITTHLAAISVDIRVPLARRFKTFRHRMEPYVRYRLTPWRYGKNPSWIVDDFDRLREGQGMEVGFITLFDNMRAPEVFIEIGERFDLPGFGDNFSPAFFYGKAIAGPTWMRLSLDGAWDHRQTTPSLAGITLSSRHGGGNQIDLGARWVGPGRGPYVDSPFSSAFGPWLVSNWSYQAHDQIEVFENLTVSLTKRLKANIGTRIGVWPNPVLHVLWYGLEFRSSCGCIGAGLVASHRVASFVPDVMFTMNLFGI